MAQKEKTNDTKRDAGKGNKEAIVVREGAKSRAGIGHMNKREEIRTRRVRLGGINKRRTRCFVN